MNDKLIQELKKREEFWRNAESDPHNIANAVSVALAEVRHAIEACEKPNIEPRKE